MTDQSDLRGLPDYHANPTAHTAVIVHVAPRWIAVGEDLPAVAGRIGLTITCGAWSSSPTGSRCPIYRRWTDDTSTGNGGK